MCDTELTISLAPLRSSEYSDPSFDRIEIFILATSFQYFPSKHFLEWLSHHRPYSSLHPIKYFLFHVKRIVLVPGVILMVLTNPTLWICPCFRCHTFKVALRFWLISFILMGIYMCIHTYTHTHTPIVMPTLYCSRGDLKIASSQKIVYQ